MDLNDHDKKSLQNLEIDALILFGSQAQGLANENSDYDIFVLGPKKQEIYDVVYDIVSAKIKKLLDIDIVFDSIAPMELKYHVAKYGKVLYQKNDSIFANFRQQIMIQHADFAEHRTIYSNATLARIN